MSNNLGVTTMKRITITMTIFLLSICINGIPMIAQQISTDEPSKFIERNLGGPRMGVTYRTWDKAELDQPKVISQFGWHFEHLVSPTLGGPSFVIQFTPLVAGVELGQIIPTATLAFGIRLPNGFEFGMGPNLLLTENDIHTALIIALGKSFEFGGVSIPFDIAFTTNPDYSRVSFMIGYSIP